MPLDEVNKAVREARELFKEIGPKASDDHDMALQFWAKLISNSAAVAALASAHYGSQAAIVHRVSIEHFAYMYGLAEGLITPERTIQQSQYEIYEKNFKGLDRATTKDENGGLEGLTEQNKDLLTEFLGDPSNDVKSAGINVFDILDQLDLAFFYDTYRLYSVYAAHANVVSKSWEPNQTEMEELLKSVCELLLLANAMWKEKLYNEQRN